MSGAHPSWDSLFCYASGTLAPGAALVLASHAESCVICAAELRFLESVGGALLDTTPTTERMAPGALEAVLARAATLEPSPPAPSGRELPAALAGRRIGRWRWTGPGLWKATIRGAAGPGERLYLLRGRAGARLPEHGHFGPERLLVLSGEFADGGHVYSAGDLIESGPDRHHQPEVRSDCCCLVSTEGPLKLSGLPRLLQPFLSV